MAVSSIMLGVQGMSCQHCVKSIKAAVGGLEGVKAVEVDLTKGQVKVDYDPDKVDISKVREAITEAGYEVQG
ncbi:MAG: copper chaperone CopZ [bacterium]